MLDVEQTAEARPQGGRELGPSVRCDGGGNSKPGDLTAHSLHFQHLMWTKGYKFKTSTVKRSLVSIVHIIS